MPYSSSDGRIQANFRALDKRKADSIESSLRRNYFARCPEGYMATDRGRDDLASHLFQRLESNRKMIVPWLDDARPLGGSSILEIGCGTGASTVALAEQGATVV